MSNSRGLGDDIKKITSAVRLDELAKKIADLTNSDCKCDERQNKGEMISHLPRHRFGTELRP